MIIVGVGCGPDLITMQGMQVISKAKLIYGSRRSIELVAGLIPEGAEVRTIEDYSHLEKLPDSSVVLSTGDPMLAGLGRPGAIIVPGISSMQVAFCRLGLNLVNAVAISAHGSSHLEAIDGSVRELKSKKTVFLLAAPAFPFSELIETLRKERLELKVAVCEDLGYPGERIEVGTPEAPPEVRSKLYSVVMGRW
jgi:cobalt-precorrin-7 (C5)-methyltransferase